MPSSDDRLTRGCTAAAPVPPLSKSDVGVEGVTGDDVLTRLVWLGHNTDAGLRLLWDVHGDLSPTDLARCLEFAWTSGQYGETFVGRTPPNAKLYRLWWYLMFRGATPLLESVSMRRLPETVTVYRGVPAWNRRQARERMVNLAWTTKRDVAEWFASRWLTSDMHVYGRQRIPFIGCAVLPQGAVLAHFDNEESEVVVDFQKIRRVNVSPLMDVNDRQAIEA